jgi:GH35 family endo-1,4-beta-xylanase
MQSLLEKIQNGRIYRISAWIKLQNAPRADIGITIRQTDSSGTIYPHIYWTTGYNDRWVYLSGFFTLNVVGTLSSLDVYFEGPAAGFNFYLDDAEVVDVSTVVGDWRLEANDRIEQIRKRDAQLTVLSPVGQPVSGIDVQIRQTKHKFAFGSCINYRVLSNPAYAQFYKDHFEWAVLENESKWSNNEPQQGQVNYTNADLIYNFCTQNGITMRGHCIFWEQLSRVQSWVQALPYAQLPDASPLRTAVENRMSSAVNHFKGKFVHWDVDNEMLTDSFYKDRLGGSIRVWMFQEANRIDPNCRLFVNEYDVLSFGRYNPEPYKSLVTNLLNSGAPVHAIGVQGHIEANFNRTSVLTNLDSLAQLGLPIWVTEFDVPQADELLRANDIEDFYRIAFSHPAVEGILMWGFWQNSQWRSNCYIVNADWSLNEAGKRYEALMDEWTTKADSVTDANGQVDFRGFQGTYDITLTPPRASATVRTINLEPGRETAQFTIRLSSVGQPNNCQEVIQFGLRLPADFDGNCRVDFRDLDLFTERWLIENPGAESESQDMPDGLNLVDFTIFAEQWLMCNDPVDSNCISS